MPDPLPWPLVRATFQEALEVEPAHWSTWLAARGLPEPVRREVEDLLQNHAAAEAEVAPARFQLLRVLGEGGFGTVHLAEQHTPVRRLVALKVLKADVASAQVAARFALERESLARMSHPNIAQVFDAGTLPDRRPYFAMEFVDGAPITRHCDRERATLEQRLRLLVDVCRGAHHAHLKGVIHRDLKPSNVMVTTVDGRAIAKIIDFGIAKASLVGDGAAVPTLDGRFLGTPAYMSPEQADPVGGQVDVRSDIYSLGVLLYELLAGSLPFDPGTDAGSGLLAMLKQLREVDPPRPSARVHATPAAAADVIAAARSTLRPALLRRLRGDLDWITMRALAKEPDRRYQSAAALADDLERHLRHEPVHASPPGFGYRLRKLVRRHRTAAIASVLVLGALVAGLVAALWQNSIARQSLEVAVARRLSAEATALAADEPLVATLLAVRGAAGEPGENANAALFAALEHCTEDWQTEPHEQAVTSLGLDDAGDRLLSADESGLLVCTTPTTGAMLHRFDEHEGAIRAAGITGDGRRAFSAGDDGLLVLYDLDRGAATARLPVGQPITRGAWSKQGEVLAIGCADGSVLVYRGAAATPLRLPGRGAAIEQIAVDAKGTAIASLDAGNHLRVVDAASGAERLVRDYATPRPDDQRQFNQAVLQFTSDAGALLVRPVDGAGGALLDLGRGGGDWAFPTPGAMFVHAVLSPDDRRIAVWEYADPGAPGGPAILDVATHHRVPLRGEMQSGIQFVAFDRTGETLLSLPVRLPWLSLWDAVTGAKLLDLRGDPHTFHSMCFEPDGRHVLAGGQNGGLYRWRTGVFDECRTLSHLQAQRPARVWSVAPDGRTALVQNLPGSAAPGALDLVATADGASLGRLLPAVGPGTRALFSPRADRVYVQDGPRLEVRSLPDLTVLRTTTLPMQLSAVDAAGSRAVGADARDGSVVVAELTSGRELLRAAASDLRALAISDDGRWVASANGNRNTATVWDVDAARCVGAIDHQGLVFDVGFLPGNGAVLTFANDTTARLTDPATLRPLRRLSLPAADAACCRVSADGRRFLIDTISDLFVFDARTGTRLLHRKIPPEERLMASFLLTPNGESIVHLRADARLQSLPLDPAAAARRLLPRGLTPAELQRFDLDRAGERSAAEQAEQQRPDNSKRCVSRARAAIDAGEWQEAFRWLELARQQRRRMSARFHLALAMAHAQRAEARGPAAAGADDVTAALDALRSCVAGGIRDAEVLANFPALRPLRGDPRFEALLAGLR